MYTKMSAMLPSIGLSLVPTVSSKNVIYGLGNE